MSTKRKKAEHLLKVANGVFIAESNFFPTASEDKPRNMCLTVLQSAFVDEGAFCPAQSIDIFVTKKEAEKLEKFFSNIKDGLSDTDS